MILYLKEKLPEINKILRIFKVLLKKLNRIINL